jgi:hypothetical protein
MNGYEEFKNFFQVGTLIYFQMEEIRPLFEDIKWDS